MSIKTSRHGQPAPRWHEEVSRPAEPPLPHALLVLTAETGWSTTLQQRLEEAQPGRYRLCPVSGLAAFRQHLAAHQWRAGLLDLRCALLTDLVGAACACLVQALPTLAVLDLQATEQRYLALGCPGVQALLAAEMDGATLHALLVWLSRFPFPGVPVPVLGVLGAEAGEQDVLPVAPSRTGRAQQDAAHVGAQAFDWDDPAERRTLPAPR
jgi:hypothetical protein